MKRFITKLMFFFFLLSFSCIGTTNASYIDSEISNNNTIQAAVWGVPILSNVNALVATPNSSNNDNKATIVWVTNEPATSNVEYGLSPGLYTDIVPHPEDTTADHTSHSLEIVSLDPETTYYYRVKSKNSNGYETVSSEYSFTTNGVRSGDTHPTDIVINEFLPNPTGNDDAPMPNGEWVELYNRGSDSVDLTGWYLTDSNPTYVLPITATNTVSSDLSTADLWIAPGEFMVVYRNGDGDFSLNNDAAGDQVNLYDSSNNLIDQHIYNSGLFDIVLENKSFARFPDGADIWFDPIPSPGRPNIFESREILPSLSFSYSSATHSVSFAVENINHYKKLEYQLTYDSENGQQGVIGAQDLNNQDQFRQDKIILGTCSSGGTCVYHSKVKNMKVEVDLFDQNNAITHLEKTIE